MWYREAPRLAQKHKRVVSTHELTGVQALERLHPGLLMGLGKVVRRECAYIWRGTCAFILSRDVVHGQLIAPYAGATRTQAYFLAHWQAVVTNDQQISQ